MLSFSHHEGSIVPEMGSILDSPPSTFHCKPRLDIQFILSKAIILYTKTY